MRATALSGVLVLALAVVAGCGISRPAGVDASALDAGLDAGPGGAADAAGTAMDAAGTTTDGTGGADAAAGAFTAIVLPDTQYYAAAFPDIFDSQLRWIVGQIEAQNIAFVLHEGDIVDTDLPEQWQTASSALHLLDGRVPYVLAAGNHDYATIADRMGMMNVYFPPGMLGLAPTFGGTFEEGHSENSFSLVPVGGQTWLLMALEFGPRDEALRWADGVLKSHAGSPAIVLTHAYLFGNERYDHTRVSRPWNPHEYVMAGQPGSSINDGEEIWRKLVLPNGNVKLVLSGHVIEPPVGRLTSTRPDGTPVHQLLANYQSCAYPCETLNGVTVRGGNGFLRILRFDPGARTLSVTTYSPYVDEWKRDPGNEFVLPWE
jgi:3',5'-cyclic AMP phosphodiesterase CpdA